MNHDAHEISGAIERGLRAEFWAKTTRDALRLLYPGPRSVDRIAQLLVDARSAGIDVGAAVRQAQHRMDELQLEASVPTENTRPTPLLRFPLSDTGRKAKDD